MPGLFIAKAIFPPPSIAMSPPSPPSSPMLAIVPSAAACTLSRFHSMRSQSWRAAVLRMKYSPVPVAETAQTAIYAGE